MAVLELVSSQPDWFGALSVAMTRPPGVPERRAAEDPWGPAPVGRPRRISDDLAWLRQAMDEPAAMGLEPIDDPPMPGVWDARRSPDAIERLVRLEERGVLQAAGFALHDAEHLSVIS